jgi:molecular chaperone DnaJ
MGPDFSGFGSISDLFDAFFGGGGATRAQRGPRAGGDIAITAEIELEQALTGDEVELTFEAIETCEKCHGNGAEPGTPIETCDRCGGAGMLQAVTRSPFGQIVRSVACDVCGGEGKVPKEPCERCDGRGREVRRRTLSVDIPAGISDGQRIRLGGRGHAGETGGPPGDLYVLVHVRAHERFLRDGDDLVTVADVPAPMAALGTKIEIEGLDGDRIQLEIPAGTQPGETLTVRGAGMPGLQRRGRSGDLRAVVDVQIPRKLDRHQRALLKELAESVRPEQLGDGESLVGRLRRLLQ